MVMPTNLRFETQAENEPIILFLRRHPITNLPWILFTIVALIAPLIFLPFFLTLDLLEQFLALSPNLPVMLLSLYYLALFGFVLSNFFVWYFTVNIVTTVRVIDIDFIFLLYKEFSEALLNRIEDVTFTMGGFIRAIFNYGDVLIQTAATTERIEFDRVPRAQEAVRIITELVHQAPK